MTENHDQPTGFDRVLGFTLPDRNARGRSGWVRSSSKSSQRTITRPP
jgi:hypothetical protein